MVSEVEKLQEEVDKILAQRDRLEEKCDTLDLCQEDDGCKKCDVYKKIAVLDVKTEELEDKIEVLLAADEED